MFRGKESSNRLNFGDLGSLWLLGVGSGCMGMRGGWRYSHTHAYAHACTHTHACTCMHGKHDNFMQMAAPIGGIPGNSL